VRQAPTGAFFMHTGSSATFQIANVRSAEYYLGRV
jgi:hypothetical protein